MDHYHPADSDACWPWTGSRDRDGYGLLTGNNREQLRAHVVSYARTHGPVPRGKQVMHTCDNPPCVNPNHLKTGTADDNNKDKAKKLRASSKLTAKDVMKIRARLATGETMASIAKAFGVTGVNVWHIKHRHSWRHIT